MNQLTRRNFLKTLAGLLALPLVKPEVVEASELDYNTLALDSLEDKEDGYFEAEMVYLKPDGAERMVRWNGAGESWESRDSGQTWIQTGFRPTIEVQPDGTLYISGNLIEVTPEEWRQRHWDYLKSLT